MEKILEKFRGYRRLYPQVRVSWSAYSHWNRGRRDLLFRYLLSQEPAPTAAQRRGRAFHEAVEELDERLLRRLFPLVGVESARSFLLEEKKEVKLHYEIPTIFVGVFDALIETPQGWVIVDWKTGKGRLKWYFEQILLYGWALKKLGFEAIRGILVKFDEDLHVVELYEEEFSDEKMKWIENRLDTFIQELHWWILTGELDEFVNKILV